ncbi:hypothetical protein ASD52_31530 [Ensifer sp. Root142]|jgi:hypothetical protein|nr:hypothetical protein ASD00_37665 [Ensifer sp. Root31]KQY69973.1 hypothetical protein ASD52_31530 [Ensifer sp. Root142]MDP9633322.1 hypothetical protein [Ensifer adhaerens]OMQ31658.1 hypothetical protein BKP54_33690 [Ensifer sp. 1H6]
MKRGFPRSAVEGGRFERLRAGRKELFEPEIARHHGQIFKLMGDGMRAKFGSVVDAVECAVSLQRGLAERNAAVTEDQRIRVKIGSDVELAAADRLAPGSAGGALASVGSLSMARSSCAGWFSFSTGAAMPAAA